MVAIIQYIDFFPRQGIEFDAGVVDGSFLLSGTLQSEQGVKSRAESYFQNAGADGGRCFQPHIDKDMLRFGACSFYRMIMLIQLRHKQCGASVFRPFYNPFHIR